MKPLTVRQQQVLDQIRIFRAEHQYSPTSRELADHFGIYQNAINNFLKALEQKGHITRRAGQGRTIVPVERDSFTH